jgi:hypothetical protein
LAWEEKGFDNFKPFTSKSTKMIFGNWTIESAYNHAKSQNFQVHWKLMKKKWHTYNHVNVIFIGITFVNAPPSSSRNSNVGPKVKQQKNQRVKTRSFVHNTSKVRRWCAPKLFDGLKCEFEMENSRRTRSRGMLPDSQHFGGRKVC